MIVSAATQPPIVARASIAAATAAPAQNAVRKDAGLARLRGPTAHEAPRVIPAEAMAERAASRLDTYRPEPGAQPAFLAHVYAHRREMGWVIPEPSVPEPLLLPASGDSSADDAGSD